MTEAEKLVEEVARALHDAAEKVWGFGEDFANLPDDHIGTLRAQAKAAIKVMVEAAHLADIVAVLDEDRELLEGSLATGEISGRLNIQHAVKSIKKHRELAQAIRAMGGET